MLLFSHKIDFGGFVKSFTDTESFTNRPLLLPILYLFFNIYAWTRKLFIYMFLLFFLIFTMQISSYTFYRNRLLNL